MFLFSMVKLSDQVREFKTKLIRLALVESHGNIRKTARMLGENPTTLARWVRILDLDGMARDLRHRHAWWLVDRCALLVAFLFTVVYAAHSLT